MVLEGGRSAERDISRLSAAAIVRHASPGRYRVTRAHIDIRGRWLINGRPASLTLGSRDWLHAGKNIPVDVVFPVLHGPMGEDGTVQGLLELAGVPYVGCDVLGSAAGMDKVVSKRLAAQAGLPLLPYAVLRKGSSLGPAKALKFPVFVKPSRMGSSVGVYKVSRPAELGAAVKKAFRYDTTVLVEQGVEPRELECAILGGNGDARASLVGEIRPNAEFYSYEAKYMDPNGAAVLVPARLPRAKAEAIRRMSLEAFRALGLYGLSRADFLMDKKTGKVYFNEVNTMPGFTAVSLYPRLWAESGVPFSKLIDRLVDLARRRHAERSRLAVRP